MKINEQSKEGKKGAVSNDDDAFGGMKYAWPIYTFLTLMVNARLSLICCVGLLIVQVRFRVLPGSMFSKSKDANWPG